MPQRGLAARGFPLAGILDASLGGGSKGEETSLGAGREQQESGETGRVPLQVGGVIARGLLCRRG